MTDQTDDTHDGPQGNAAYRRILEEIRTGRLLPGDRLRETDLASSLGMSRTPVREAIRQLESDGIVIHAPRQGAAIRSLDHAEVVELYEMRAVLEGTAARLAARAATEVELGELNDLNAALAAATSGAAAADLNRLFHATLMNVAKNRFLARSMRSLQKALMILGPTTLADAARSDAAVAEHALVLDALAARDGEAAERAMRAHIDASQAARLRSLRARNMDGGGA